MSQITWTLFWDFLGLIWLFPILFTGRYPSLLWGSEQEKLALHQAGFLAQKRLARGLRLNRSEAIALLCTVLHELIRDGGELQPDKVAPSLADLMERGKRILGYRHVLPGVSNLIHDIQVEGTFDDGVFLLTVHEPISSENGDIAAALYGSFLPIPPENSFAPFNEADISPEKTPGAVIALADAPIHINSGRGKAIIKVHNKGDRPIQVGSHYHFIETNPDLEFDRALAYGKRLDIAAGTAKRFEHDPQTVTLVDIGGSQIISGGNNLASGPYDPRRVDQIVENLVKMGFRHKPEPEAPLWDGLSPIPLGSGSDAEKWVEVLERETYIKMFGPTAGDRLRLGDTDLWIEVEKDHTLYGDEVKFGGGKVIREGMGQATNRSAGECLDLVITNALIIDWSGIIKADIGIKDGYIVGVGKAGNPDTQSGIHPSNMVIGATTEVLAGEKTIITAGAIDTHIHFICPQQVDEALAGGTTTMIGGGTGPNHGTLATTATPGPMWMRMMLAATDELPMNIGFTGKGNDAGRGGNIIAQGGDADSVVTYNGAIGPEETIRAGAIGLKLHEDWGSTPAAIDSCLSLAEKYDVQVAIHTDTLNESGYVDRTIKAFRGRAIHTYHTEGAGGGHAPDIITVVSEENVLPSSTNPTRPYAKNTVDEHFDMLVVCHHLDPDNIQEDAAFADSRIRKETMAAEDVLHDLGAISMISSDSQAMGRVGEVVSRTWRTANKMKQMRGPLFQLGDEEGKDNARVKRFISKYTINPAITHGISHVVGDIAPGKLADLVIWKPENFGAKPEIILKSGVIVLAQMGDGNGSISTVQPISLKPMWGSKVAAAALNSVSFVSQISITTNTVQTYGLKKRFEAVKGCRDVRKKDLKWNSYTPKMKVDPENYNVHADGVPMIVDPAEELPLTRAYNVF